MCTDNPLERREIPVSRSTSRESEREGGREVDAIRSTCLSFHCLRPYIPTSVVVVVPAFSSVNIDLLIAALVLSNIITAVSRLTREVKFTYHAVVENLIDRF